jgi:hypothetical protein
MPATRVSRAGDTLPPQTNHETLEIGGAGALPLKEPREEMLVAAAELVAAAAEDLVSPANLIHATCHARITTPSGISMTVFFSAICVPTPDASSGTSG